MDPKTVLLEGINTALFALQNLHPNYKDTRLNKEGVACLTFILNSKDPLYVSELKAWLVNMDIHVPEEATLSCLQYAIRRVDELIALQSLENLNVLRIGKWRQTRTMI